MTTEALALVSPETPPIEPTEAPLDQTEAPPPGRWVAVNALGLARNLISLGRLTPGLAYSLVAHLPETVPPAQVLFPDPEPVE